MTGSLTPQPEGDWLGQFDDWVMLPVVECPDHNRLLDPMFVGFRDGRAKVLLICPMGHRFEWEKINEKEQG